MREKGMFKNMTDKLYLVLESGEVFEGYSVGADLEAVGELVFTTGVVGYLENLTDPAYAGQIVVQTFPEIGNYGVIGEDIFGKCRPAGYVVSELCEDPSNFRCEGRLGDFLVKHNIPVIAGVDTREITRILREKGSMNAKIAKEIPADMTEISGYAVKNRVSSVSTEEKYTVQAKGEAKFRVTVIDCGVTKGIIDELTDRGCTVTVVPYSMSAEEIFVSAPDGIVVSGGPGNPAECTSVIRELKKMIGRRPVFALGLGHQLTAIAMGAKTYKMKTGHRGSNQPVREVGGTRTYITEQNHGYAVMNESLPMTARLSFSNVNDRSCEGIEYRGQKCFTVQFTPNHDTSFIYDQFITMMGGGNNA